MKSFSKIYAVAALATLALVSCDPIEDTDLRKSWENAGEAISSAELTKALEVKQMENLDTRVEGDQYIIVKNNRPDIGGVWCLEHDGVVDTWGTDADTLVATANGEYTLTYKGIHNNKQVTSQPIALTVTNCFDEFDSLLFGAKDKTDKGAKKVWKLRNVEVKSGRFSYCNMGAYGGWKYTSAGYTPESDFIWWASITDAEIGDKINWRMVFNYSGGKYSVLKTDGTATVEGNVRYTHNTPDEMVKGELVPSGNLLGSEYDECGKANMTMWILTLNEKYMTLFHPAVYTGGVDWSDYGWYVYYEAVEE